MRLQQIVVADMHPTVRDQAFHLLKHRPQVFALKDIVHVKTETLHLLDEILRGVSVIADLEREDLILLDQPAKPRLAVVVVHKVVARQRQQTALDEDVVRNAVALDRIVDALFRKEELREDVELTVPLDDRTARSQVACLR